MNCSKQRKPTLKPGETAAAIEKIEAAKAVVENEGVEPISESATEPDDDVPLPGQGSNGVQP